MFGCLVYVAVKRLPFDIAKKGCAWDVRDFPSQHGQMIYAPGNHHVDTKAGMKSVGIAELPIFEAATAF
jgi:hypothetical protein